MIPAMTPRRARGESCMAFKDPEKRKAYQRSWAAANRAKNPEAFREAARKYRAKNLEIVREKERERRRELAASKAKN
jgi:DNA-binding IclR family transcriptional regulator